MHVIFPSYFCFRGQGEHLFRGMADVFHSTSGWGEEVELGGELILKRAYNEGLVLSPLSPSRRCSVQGSR